MDWLSEHYTFIVCRDKKMTFEIPSEGTYYCDGVRSHTPEAVLIKLTCMVTEASTAGYLVSV